jgi:hypothetical protein
VSDPRDKELSRIYSEAGWPEPRQQIDDAILAASRRATGSRPRAAGAAFTRRWATPVAFAATVLLTFSLLLMVSEEKPEDDEMLSPPLLDARPVPPAEQPATPFAAEPKPAPELKKQAPDAASRGDQSRQFQGNRAQSGEAARAEKGFVPDAARADRVQRELDQLQQTRRARESAPPRGPQPAEPQPEPMPAPMYEAPSGLATPAAPARSASPPPGAGASVQGRIPGTTLGAVERSPGTWLEDIRKLKAQGRTAEVERELAEFKRRYPDYRLPEDLR